MILESFAVAMLEPVVNLAEVSLPVHIACDSLPSLQSFLEYETAIQSAFHQVQ
jgi:hypothetical protein